MKHTSSSSPITDNKQVDVNHNDNDNDDTNMISDNDMNDIDMTKEKQKLYSQKRLHIVDDTDTGTIQTATTASMSTSTSASTTSSSLYAGSTSSSSLNRTTAKIMKGTSGSIKKSTSKSNLDPTPSSSTSSSSSSTSTSTTQFDWMKLKIIQIPILPNYYIYDSENIILCSIQFLYKIQKHLLNLFRTLSFMIEYKNYGTTIICQDIEGIQFHIVLWKKKMNTTNHDTTNTTTKKSSNKSKEKEDKEDDEMLMIEVRHTGGNIMIFQQNQYTELVLQTVQSACSPDSGGSSKDGTCSSGQGNNTVNDIIASRNNYNNQYDMTSNHSNMMDYNPTSSSSTSYSFNTNIPNYYTATPNIIPDITNTSTTNSNNSTLFNKSTDPLYFGDSNKCKDEMELSYQILQRRCNNTSNTSNTNTSNMNNMNHETTSTNGNGGNGIFGNDDYSNYLINIEHRCYVILHRIEQLIYSNNMECVYDGLITLLNVTNPNRRIAESIATSLLTGTNITTNMLLSLGFKQSWYYPPTNSTTENTNSNIKNTTSTNNTSNIDFDDIIDDMRCDKTILHDYILIALRVIGQSIYLLDHTAIEQFVFHTNTLLQQDDNDQEQQDDVDDDDVQKNTTTTKKKYINIQSVLLEYMKNVIDAPHIAYCATHILARLCETIPEICLDVQGNYYNNDNSSNNTMIDPKQYNMNKSSSSMNTTTNPTTETDTTTTSNVPPIIIQNAHLFGMTNNSAVECAIQRLMSAIDHPHFRHNDNVIAGSSNSSHHQHHLRGATTTTTSS